jgi:sugar phosphate isomerase/epimerase
VICNAAAVILIAQMEMLMKLAVQLYTVRDLTSKDMPGTLKRLREIGYRAVELAGYGNLKNAREVKTALDDTGMLACASHAPIEQLEADLPRALDEAATLGHTNLVCPWMPENRRADARGWRETAGALSRIGAACREKGFTLSYHNHSFEFQKFDGKTGFDIFCENSDPESLKLELDVYWANHGGEDPVAMIKKLGRRIALLHLKDMAAGAEQRFAPVGAGILDFPGILSAGDEAQVPWGIVEQDACYELPPLEAVKISYENLKTLM